MNLKIDKISGFRLHTSDNCDNKSRFENGSYQKQLSIPLSILVEAKVYIAIDPLLDHTGCNALVLSEQLCMYSLRYCPSMLHP